MAVKTDKVIFYHIPKTGGIWVKRAMRKAGLKYGRCKEHKNFQHDFTLKREHGTPDTVQPAYQDGLFSFCFVRHPLGWYKSFWCYRLKTGKLSKKFPADAQWVDDFETFLLNMVGNYPDGFVTRLYQYYDLDGMDYIGRQESLTEDLIAALTLAGEQFDEAALRRTRPRNISAGNPRFGERCIYSDEIRDLLLGAEHWVMDTFYREEKQ